MDAPWLPHAACHAAVYALGLSPNQTPYRDTIFIKLLTGISQDSTFSVNQVYFRQEEEKGGKLK